MTDWMMFSICISYLLVGIAIHIWAYWEPKLKDPPFACTAFIVIFGWLPVVVAGFIRLYIRRRRDKHDISKRR